MESSVLERIKKVIKDNGYSITFLSKELGIVQTTLNRQIKGEVQLSAHTIEAFLHYFPSISASWLLTGEGSMLKDATTIPPKEKGTFNGTPVYDIDATCGTQTRDIHFTEEHIVGSIDLPEISKSSSIIRANGDSMEPKISSGDFIVVRQIMNWNDIFYGQIYLILMEEYRMIKYIRRYEQDEENYIILRSENPKYDDIKLHKSKIIKLFIVENILSVKNQL